MNAPSCASSKRKLAVMEISSDSDSDHEPSSSRRPPSGSRRRPPPPAPLPVAPARAASSGRGMGDHSCTEFALTAQELQEHAQALLSVRRFRLLGVSARPRLTALSLQQRKPVPRPVAGTSYPTRESFVVSTLAWTQRLGFGARIVVEEQRGAGRLAITISCAHECGWTCVGVGRAGAQTTVESVEPDDASHARCRVDKGKRRTVKEEDELDDEVALTGAPDVPDPAPLRQAACTASPRPALKPFSTAPPPPRRASNGIEAAFGHYSFDPAPAQAQASTSAPATQQSNVPTWNAIPASEPRPRSTTIDFATVFPPGRTFPSESAFLTTFDSLTQTRQTLMPRNHSGLLVVIGCTGIARVPKAGHRLCPFSIKLERVDADADDARIRIRAGSKWVHALECAHAERSDSLVSRLFPRSLASNALATVLHLQSTLFPALAHSDPISTASIALVLSSPLLSSTQKSLLEQAVALNALFPARDPPADPAAHIRELLFPSERTDRRDQLRALAVGLARDQRLTRAQADVLNPILLQLCGPNAVPRAPRPLVAPTPTRDGSPQHTTRPPSSSASPTLASAETHDRALDADIAAFLAPASLPSRGPPSADWPSRLATLLTALSPASELGEYAAAFERVGIADERTFEMMVRGRWDENEVAGSELEKAGLSRFERVCWAGALRKRRGE